VGSAGAGEFIADTFVPQGGGCHFHFHSQAEALSCVAQRKSLLLLGDSTTLGVVLALLQLLDSPHTDSLTLVQDTVSEVQAGLLSYTWSSAGLVQHRVARPTGSGSLLSAEDVLATLREVPEPPPGGAALTYVMVTDVGEELPLCTSRSALLPHPSARKAVSPLQLVSSSRQPGSFCSPVTIQ
jgi:hypothetical protein